MLLENNFFKPRRNVQITIFSKMFLQHPKRIPDSSKNNMIFDF